MVVRTLDYGDTRIATRKQVRRPQQATDTYMPGVVTSSEEREVVGFLVFCGFGR